MSNEDMDLIYTWWFGDTDVGEDVDSRESETTAYQI